MVLQDVGNPASDGFPDNPPPSEQDTWVSPHGRFDPSLLPQPIPVLGIPLGFSSRAIRFKAEATMKIAEDQIKRKLNPEESQALAYHIYDLERTKSYFATAAGAIGVWRWYTTMMKTQYSGTIPRPTKLPGMKSDPPPFNPDKFGFFRGPAARIARQTWRFSLYYIGAGFLGGIIGQVYAQPSAVVRTSADPKLQEFNEELRTKTTIAMKERAKVWENREAQRQLPNRMARQPSPQNPGNQAASAQSTEDDSSPTAWNDAWSSNSATESWESFSNESSSQGAQQQQNSQRQQARRPPGSWDRRPPPTGQSASPSNDDASLTGGFFQEEVLNSESQAQAQPQPPSQSKPGESVWDRLRRGGPPPQNERLPQLKQRRPGPEHTDTSQSPTGGDPFNFSDGEEERRRERERAQREFDARVERERQGRDFESEENKKW